MVFNAGEALGGAAQGAVRGGMAGSVLGPVGSGVGALIGAGLAIAPEIGKWLGGAEGQQTATEVAQVIEQVAGTNDPDVLQSVLHSDPGKATELRARLAQIAADREEAWRYYELESIKAHLADTANARGTMVQLAERNSPLAYGAAVVTVVLLAIWAYIIVMGIVLEPGLSETHKTMTIAAVFYWVGSSRGSAAKDGAKSLDGRA